MVISVGGGNIDEGAWFGHADMAHVFFKPSISVVVSATNYEPCRMRRFKPIGLFSPGSQSEIGEALITLGDFR